MCRRSILTGIACAIFVISSCRTDSQLVWHDEGEYRWAELPVLEGGRSGFDEISPAKSGVTFVNTLEEENLLENRHYMNGSGVAVGDFDGDGWADIYFARLDGPNVLYRNLGGWRFEDVTEGAGVAASDRYSTGAVFADVDGDGDLDLLVTAMGGPNALFLNDGSGRFTESTALAGLSSSAGSTTMTLADVDGDGDLDLYIANYKVRTVSDMYPPWEYSFEQTVERDGNGFRIVPRFAEHYELIEHAGGLLRVERGEANHFYLNDGQGHFTRVPLTEGTFRDENGESLPPGFQGEGPEDWTLTVRFQDADGDGVPDLYVCNDFHSPDYFFRGDGSGGFEAVAPLTLRKTSFSTMSVDFSDIDRDGDLDFFLTDMLSRDHVRRQTQVGLTIPMTTEIGEIENRPQAVQNTLFINRGDNTYAETARLSGVAASDWTWSGLFLDVDLDGYEDLLLATGHAFDVLNIDAQEREFRKGTPAQDHESVQRLLLGFPELPLENVAFRNLGDGTFHFKPKGWGFGRDADVSNAMAFGDFDNDGYIDVVVNRLNETAGLFRNEASAPRLAVRLRGRSPNTQAVGGKIRVSGGGLPTQEKEVVSGGQYLSGSDPSYTFAAGTVDSSLTIEVTWRSGAVTRIEGIPANRTVEIDEPADGARDPESTRRSGTESIEIADTWFTDRSDRLRHQHVEAPLSDFESQPLIPRSLSRSGPAAAWIDLDGDGDDDLIVGAGRGGRMGVYLNDGRGFFSEGGGLDDLVQELDAEVREGLPDDMTGLVAHARSGGGARVFAALSNLKRGAADSSFILVFDVDINGRWSLKDRLAFGTEDIGPLALADIDGDGDLDLFAGGRSRPGRYPEAASSRIYTNDDGILRLDDRASASLADLGVVSGAAFGDLDGDGDADLVLATEWGAIRYFENDGKGMLVDQTESVGLDQYRGLWNGVALGDFDGDGRLDLIGTNWGWNGIHERLHAADTPIRLYYSDFDANGSLDVVESYYDSSVGDYVPVAGLNVLSEAMPYVRQRMPDHESFASSTLREIIGPKLDRAAYLDLGTLSSMVFMNRMTDRGLLFEGSALPTEAQVTPAFAAAVGDFDADGREDVFLSQNFFALPPDVPRQDAGRGLLLLGDGTGKFNPAAGQETGIKVYGEQRAAALSDIDADGRADLLVSQNGAQTKIFKNELNTGLLIHLDGSSGNPSGVGSTLRLKYRDGSLGPSRLISAGSGYLSQNSSSVVLGFASENRVEAVVVIQWPDGILSEVRVPPDAVRLTVVQSGVDQFAVE